MMRRLLKKTPLFIVNYRRKPPYVLLECWSKKQNKKQDKKKNRKMMVFLLNGFGSCWSNLRTLYLIHTLQKLFLFFSVFVTTYQIQALEKVIHTLWHAIIQWCCCFWLHISYPFAHCMRCGLLFLTPHSNSLFEFHSLDQEGKGGYRHPRREFMGDSDFGQARCADFENQCYTGN